MLYMAITKITSITIHREAGEAGGHFFKSSLSSPPALQTIRH